MVAISLLFIYMSFLLCLDPLMNQNKKVPTTTATSNIARQPKHGERQVNQEVHLDNPTQECVFSEPVPSGLQSNHNRSSAVLNLVTHEQSKWRKNVLIVFVGLMKYIFLVLGSTTTTISL